MTEQEKDEIERALTTPDPPPLSEFIERTAAFRLDRWQKHLCGILQSLIWQKGKRYLIHGPPQAGKSVIVSQRFPAYAIGCLPTVRVKLACYNISHATRFSKINRELMRDYAFQQMFPSAEVGLSPEHDTQEEWSTLARAGMRDGQASFMALGLLSGFVGQGADILVIDDPYASPQDALSAAVRESVWTFWNDGARVRLNDDTNVVVMFHRYHEDDFAGRLIAREGLKEKGGKWELFRYAAEADGLEDLPPDPLGRKVGERLTPRMSDEYIAEQKKDQIVWLGQFQGTPSAKDGLFFKVSELKIEDAAPAAALKKRQVRAWDLAATEGAGDWTAGVKMAGPCDNGLYWVVNVKRGQWGPEKCDSEVKQAAELDGREVWIRGSQDPGSAGKRDAKAWVKMLAGFTVRTERVSGPKEARARAFASQVNAGNVRLVRGSWNQAFIEELRAFPRGSNDDQVDGGSDAFSDLASKKIRTEADMD